MNFEGMLSVFCNLQKSILHAICGVPETLRILLFVLDVWFWWYLWWPDNFLTWSFAFRSRLWMVFVVAGHPLLFHVFLQKSILNAICGVPEHLRILLFALEAWFWWYLSWPDLVRSLRFSFRNRFWVVFVVAGGTLESHNWRYYDWFLLFSYDFKTPVKHMLIFINIFLMILRFRSKIVIF